MVRPQAEMHAGQVETYDLFLTFAEQDRDWVHGFLLPSLGLPPERVITKDDFELASPVVDEFVRAVEDSRFTAVVLTGAYLTDPWAAFGERLASFSTLEGDRKLVPIKLEDVAPPLQLRYLIGLDCTDPARWELEAARLRKVIDLPPPLRDEPPCPYPGMVPFREDDERFFHGREEEIADLLLRLRHQGCLCVIGPSGSGKSSLLSAGVLPELRRRRGTAVVVRRMRPGPAPLAALAATLGATGDVDVTDPAVLAQLAGAVADAEGAERLLLVVDQLEEAFAQASAEEQRTFMSALAALRPVERCQLLLAVRADFYPELMTSPLWPLGEAERVEIAPLAGQALARAIEEPAHAVGVYLQPQLVQRLLADAAHEPGVLPLVQETMVLLWEEREQKLLTLRAYERLGGEGRSGLAVALASKADATLAALDPAQQAIARRIFLRLVQLGEGRDDTRIQRIIAALRSGEPEDLFDATLDRLTDHRLLTRGGDPGEEGTVDLAHEALIASWPTLRGWIAADREWLRVHRQLADDAREWDRMGRVPDVLYRGARLVAAGEWADEHRDDLNQLEQAFLDASRALEAEEREREQRANRRLRRLVTGLAGLLVVAVLAGMLAWRAQVEASRQREIAREQTALAEEEARLSQARFLSAQSAADVDGHLARALLLGLESLNTQETVEGWTSLLDGLQQGSPVAALLHGDAGPLQAVDWSADGRVLVVGTFDGHLLRYDGATLEPMGDAIPTGHGRAHDVVVSADGQMIVSAGNDGTVQRWDARTGVPLGEPMSGHTDSVNAVALSPDGRLIASASFDRTARLWDAASGDPVGEPLAGHTDRIHAVAFSPDGATVATGGHDGRVLLWDTSTAGPADETVGTQPDRIRTVAWSPDGTLLATGSRDTTIRLWDTATGEPVGEPLRGHDRIVTSVTFSPDGTRLVSGSSDHTVRVWDVAERRQVRAPLRAHGAQVADVAFGPDGATLATSASDGVTVVWDLDRRRRLVSTFETEQPVRTVAYSADGETLVTVGDGPIVQLYDSATGDPRGAPLSGHDGWVRAAAFGAGGMLATGGDDATVRLWDATTGTPVGDPLSGHDGWVRAVAFSPDGALLASAGEDGTVRLWDPVGGRPVAAPLSGHEGPVRAVAFSPDGTLLATGGQDRTVRLWDAASGAPVGDPLQGHRGAVRSVAFSPDGERLASGSEDARVQIWDVAAGEPLGDPLVGPQFRVTSVAWSPRGDLLASGSYDRTVLLWDAESRQQLGPALEGHADFVESLAFNPQGTKLASAGLDGQVMVWDTAREAWRSQACDLAARNLTQEEWQRFMGDRPAAPTCPEAGGDEAS